MLQDWDNFYILAGTAAATLTGLLFVVITLGVQLSASEGAERAIDAFVTPTLAHFVGVLFQALTMVAPWSSALPAAILLALGGLAGLAYVIVVFRRLRKLPIFALDTSDWITYAIAPGIANASVIAGAAGLIAQCRYAPYAIAGSMALLLFVGVRDAWDLTVWMVRNRKTDRAT